MVVVRDHFHSSSPFPKPLDLASRSFHLHLLLPSFDQAGMVSSPSFSVSSFSSTRSSLVPPPREEEYRPSDSLGDQSGPQSSSSGVMVGADAKALQAMKSHHDFDSTHDVRQSPNWRGASRSCALDPGFSTATPVGTARQRKKDWCKSLRKANRAVTKGKGPVDVPEEPPAPRRKPKSVKELCSASAGVDGRDYLAIRMCNLPEKAPDAPLEAYLRPLTQGMLGQLRGVRTQVRQIEIELLELTRSKDALQEDLPRRAIEDYKKSPGFEMGLVQMGRVSLEYGYQLALARLQA
ncbi:hypothetical protein B296_00035329 [Ensete ventricosum]|uniref:Uncharacterized protein n=1 Tax=Ensete ventricosum TaxID=4639 RepID=A0A426ZJF9_ENSVE|nr:hypothetical protein B296_00035329 [Ensete ventricosum]